MSIEPRPDTPVSPASPPQKPPVHQRTPRREERLTRKPQSWWDRLKILVLFVGGFLFLWWAEYVRYRESGISAGESLEQAVEANVWLLVLAAIEFLRQAHYFLSERSVRYHQFWTKKVWGRWHERAGRMNPWNRYRAARALKILFFLLILDLVLAKIYDVHPAEALVTLPARLFSFLPFILQLAFGFFFVMMQFIGLFWFLSRGGSEIIFPEDIDKRFDDVKGQDSVLEKVKENIIFLEQPDLIEAKGGKIPKGILLWGPPGTGKTLMAKAVAGETSRPFIFVEPGAFMNMFFGVGILKVKSLFRKARKLSLRHGGVIMFFDEADALGNRGAGVQQQFDPPGTPWFTDPPCNGLSYLSPAAAHLVLQDRMQAASVARQVAPRRDGIIAGMGGMGGGMGTLQALLGEMDGMDRPRGFVNRTVRRMLGMRPKPPPKYRVLVVMATNMPDVLDPAMLRPGRIDRLYKVGYPSKKGRMETLWLYLAKVKHVLTEEQVDKMGTITPYYGGAALEDLVNAALINAIGDGRDTIEWRDMVKAKQLKDLGPPEDVEYIERERHAVAVHEACHAVAAYRVRHHLQIDIATIEKGGSYLGVVTNIPPEDLFTQWKSDYEADIMASLASLAGERMFFQDDSSSGVSGDLENATRTATLMEGYWGMGETVASYGVTHQVGISGGGRPGSGGKKERDLLESDLGFRIERRLGEILGRTRELLERNRLEVLAVAHALETHKTLNGEDVTAVIEGRQGPIVDGRPYHDGEMARVLEDYHEELVSAHQAHSEPRVRLPVVTGPFQAELPLPNGGGAAGSDVLEVSPEEEDGQRRSEEPDGGGDGGSASAPAPDGPPAEDEVIPEALDPGALPEPDLDP